MRSLTHASFALAAGLVGGCQLSDDHTSTIESTLAGATFTTLPDGSAVNHNIYNSKLDVYLDGGPPDNAPIGAAALDPGTYYFQVTDPGCKELLSEDALANRQFTVNDDGVVSAVFNHVTGIDEDHDSLTVQLMPYADTPNPGGEYKVWITPTDAIDTDAPGNCFGFVGRYSKTDNFKVRELVEPPPPLCPNGYVDEGEECDDGNTTNGDGCSSMCEKEHKEPCCGDGYKDAGEECDDGNTTSGDGCSSTCQLEHHKEPCCGDGYLDPYEQCDDGNTTSWDGCSSTCEYESMLY